MDNTWITGKSVSISLVEACPLSLAQCQSEYPPHAQASSHTHRFHPFRELVSTTLWLLWVHSSCSSSKIGWKGKGSRTIVSAWDKIFQLLCEGDLRPITDWVNSFLCSLKDFVVVSLNCFLWSGSHPVKENPLVSKPLVDDCQSRATLLLRRIAPSKWCQGTNEYKRLEFPL